VHATYRTPYVAMLFTTALSLGIALVLRNELDLLASFVNFGALTAFLFLHVSVLAEFAWRRKSRHYFSHWAVPVLGIVIVLQILTGMAGAAVKLGAIWLCIGVAYGLFLHFKKKINLEM
jgi:amino acid transporter